ncbi:helix-turn-helix domain-containing protein [Streptomyces sp. W16]|uniref:TetR/AcrR family transcriptional regulator n=1 Tax=Streptomyces sp. W16 TaxID=3076631 RepID=UPI00295B1D03|nr:helix-turn-helix domain-containing protein [Streptomyces sp. W16]MDV9177918.1 helix-turn-helix domain-containing protein [Streptomyces sp. W16]
MAETESSGARKRAVGRPRRIEAAQIVDVARRILQEEGIEAVSMRRVAKEVGTTPMALYHHVRDKDALLMLTLSGLASTLPRPVLSEDPRERILATTAHMQALLGSMPWLADVLVHGDLLDKGALWMVEEIVDSFIVAGLTPEEAVSGYRTIWYLVLGDLIYRRGVDRRAAEQEHERYFTALVTEEDADELPRLVGLWQRWDELTVSYDLARQLEAVLDGLLPGPGRDTGPS